MHEAKHSFILHSKPPHLNELLSEDTSGWGLLIASKDKAIAKAKLIPLVYFSASRLCDLSGLCVSASLWHHVHHVHGFIASTWAFGETRRLGGSGELCWQSSTITPKISPRLLSSKKPHYVCSAFRRRPQRRDKSLIPAYLCIAYFRQRCLNIDIDKWLILLYRL